MQLSFSPEDLRPVVESVVAEMLDRFGDDGRVAFTEAESAKLIGVPRHVLRDERLKGNIEHGRAGKKILYTRRHLMKFVDERQP